MVPVDLSALTITPRICSCVSSASRSAGVVVLGAGNVYEPCFQHVVIVLCQSPNQCQHCSWLLKHWRQQSLT